MTWGLCGAAVLFAFAGDWLERLPRHEPEPDAADLRAILVAACFVAALVIVIVELVIVARGLPCG